MVTVWDDGSGGPVQIHALRSHDARPLTRETESPPDERPRSGGRCGTWGTAT